MLCGIGGASLGFYSSLNDVYKSDTDVSKLTYITIHTIIYGGGGIIAGSLSPLILPIAAYICIKCKE